MVSKCISCIVRLTLVFVSILVQISSKARGYSNLCSPSQYSFTMAPWMLRLYHLSRIAGRSYILLQGWCAILWASLWRITEASLRSMRWGKTTLKWNKNSWSYQQGRVTGLMYQRCTFVWWATSCRHENIANFAYIVHLDQCLIW